MRESRAIRILVIDHEPTSLQATIAQLRRMGDGVAVAGEFVSPLAAIQQVGALEPKVAIVRMRMPELDGITCLRRIKQSGRSGVCNPRSRMWSLCAERQSCGNALGDAPNAA